MISSRLKRAFTRVRATLLTTEFNIELRHSLTSGMPKMGLIIVN